MSGWPDRGDALGLAMALVAIDSRNPSLDPSGPGEGVCAEWLAGCLDAWGLEVGVQRVEGTRANVIARAGPRGVAPLVLNGHLDVVGVEGMAHAPFVPAREGGRLFGRGSCDMKGGIAAMCAAVARASRDGALAREVWLTAVADEEWQSAGTSALLAAWRDGAPAGLPAPERWPLAAVVTEPTRLAICPAHRGFEWACFEVEGRAAHGSRYELGVDAIVHAGLLLGELDRLERDVLPLRTHPLLGRASVHASRIEGGSGMSSYPASCTVWVERRTLPGETRAGCLAEFAELVARVTAARPEVRITLTGGGGQPPSDVSVEAPVVRAVAAALAAVGESVTTEGMSAWTDAALFNAAGIPAVCFGPGDIALAHAATEWIDVDEIERATAVLARLVATPVEGA